MITIKKQAVLLLVIGMVLIGSGFCLARNLSPKELAAAKKAELNNTNWTIHLKSISDKKGAGKDIVSFSEGKVFSKKLSRAGFLEADFIVRLNERGTVIWEAMQTDNEGNFAFWHGDIEEGVMRGVLNKRDSKGRIFDFTFVSK